MKLGNRVLLGLVVSLGLGLFLGACSAIDSPRDIEEILVGDVQVVDIGPTSAVIQAETSIDVVCAVSYGESTRYGKIATDDDMAGGGHGDHQPVLRGLKPDTTYRFNLGGMGPDGTLYRSGDLTFRTLSQAVGQVPADTRNLALSEHGARVVGVSSNYGGGSDSSAFGAMRAVDGDPGTEWSSDGDGNSAWIEIELPAVTRITSLGLWTRTMGTSAQIFSFRVITDSGETMGPFSLEDARETHYFEVDLRAKRLRFEVIDSSGGNTGLVEVFIGGE